LTENISADPHKVAFIIVFYLRIYFMLDIKCFFFFMGDGWLG